MPWKTSSLNCNIKEIVRNTYEDAYVFVTYTGELFVQTFVIRPDRTGRRPVCDGSEGRCYPLQTMRDVVEVVVGSMKPEKRARRIKLYGMASHRGDNLENGKHLMCM